MLLPRAAGGAGQGAGRSLFWPPLLATWGEGGESGLHAHHAWHLLVARQGELRVRESARGRWRAAGAVLTRPRAPHAIAAHDAEVVVVFVAPESDLGAGLAARPAATAAAVELLADDAIAAMRTALPTRLDAAGVAAALPALLAAAGLPEAALARARVHPAVGRVLRHLAGAPADADVSLEALARVADLSAGRFMHAFTESVGLPLRPYLLWHKLGRAGAAIAAGQPLSDAAHAAGFADAAHLTRTFRRMFGVAPSEARRRTTS